MHLKSTQISEEHVHLRFENVPTNGEATEWIDIQVKHMADECQPLAVTRRAALDSAQAAIRIEIPRLQSLSSRTL
jgi:hypothetical protein